MYTQLIEQLNEAHGKNANGVLRTDWSRIRDLELESCTTNGTSGIGMWHGFKVYFYLDSRAGSFVVEHYSD